MINLPEEKRNSIINLANRFLLKKSCKIRELAQFLGTLAASWSTVSYGWIYTKQLEREKFLALRESGNNFDAKMTLSEKVDEDSHWWIRRIPTSFSPIRTRTYKKIIFTGASLSGWGSVSEGKTAHGWWNEEEQNCHTDYLELKAALYGLKCFAKDCHNCEILLRVGNTTAISYINRMGGIQIPRLTKISRSIWHQKHHTSNRK